MKGSVKKTKKTQHEGQRYQNKKKKQDKDFRGQYFCPPTERQKNLAPWAVDADVAEQVFFFFFLKKFFPLFSTALRPCAVDAGVAKGVFFCVFLSFFLQHFALIVDAGVAEEVIYVYTYIHIRVYMYIYIHTY